MVRSFLCVVGLVTGRTFVLDFKLGKCRLAALSICFIVLKCFVSVWVDWCRVVYRYLGYFCLLSHNRDNIKYSSAGGVNCNKEWRLVCVTHRYFFLLLCFNFL